MPLPRSRVFIAEREVLTGSGIPVRTLDNMHLVFILSATDIQKRGNPGRIIRRVRLERADLQSLAERLSIHQSLIDGIRLVTVRDDRIRPEDAHRRIDDQAWILHLRFIISLRADSLPVRDEDTVSAVCGSSHNKIRGHRISSVLRASDHDPASRIGVACQFLRKSLSYHLFSYLP